MRTSGPALGRFEAVADNPFAQFLLAHILHLRTTFTDNFRSIAQKMTTDRLLTPNQGYPPTQL